MAYHLWRPPASALGTSADQAQVERKKAKVPLGDTNSNPVVDRGRKRSGPSFSNSCSVPKKSAVEGPAGDRLTASAGRMDVQGYCAQAV